MLVVELLGGGATAPCTDQVSDMLIVENDTFYVNIVFHHDSAIIDFIDQERLQNVVFEHDNCETTYCYDQYYVVWTIVDRTIYLKDIISCCSGEGIDMINLFGDRYIPAAGLKGSFVNEGMMVWNMLPIISNIIFEEECKFIDVSIQKGIISKKEMQKLRKFAR